MDHDLLKLFLASGLAGAGAYAVPRLASSLTQTAMPAKPKNNAMEITMPRQQLEKISNPIFDILGDGAGLVAPALAVGAGGYAGYKGLSSVYNNIREKQINEQIQQEREKYVASLHASMQPKQAMEKEAEMCSGSIPKYKACGHTVDCCDRPHKTVYAEEGHCPACKPKTKEASEHVHKHYKGCGHTSACRCMGPKETVEAEGECPECKWNKQKFTKKASVETPLVDAFCEAIEKAANYRDWSIFEHDTPVNGVDKVMNLFGAGATGAARLLGVAKPIGASLLAIGGGAAALPFILGARAKAKSQETTPGYENLPSHLKLNVV